MTTIYAVVEEYETGSNALMDPYLILAAYKTEAVADAAMDAWRLSHDDDAGMPHQWEAAEEDGNWCLCGKGVSITEVELL